MGTWSTAILGNDESMDLYSVFERMYLKKIDTNQIKGEICSKFSLFDKKGNPILNDNTNRWLAYTQICWECNCLDEIHFTTTEQIINNKIDVDNFEKEDRTERIQELEGFLKQIKKKAKKKTIPKKYTLIPNIKIGDCIAFKHDDGLYGGAICLHIKEGREDYPINSYLLAITRIYQSQKPTFSDFEHSHLLIYNYKKTIDGEQTAWGKNKKPKMIYHYTGEIKSIEDFEYYENDLAKLEVIGNLPIKEFKVKNESYSLTFQIGLYHTNQFEWEKNNPEAINLTEPVSNYLQ